MRFSIIIPVYNVEDYLAYCLDSVMNQSFRDFEVILVNDGSTDKSGEICEAYARKYPEHIRLIHQENQGLVKTRVTGLHRVGGEICIFVDSDDALRLDALEKIHEVFAKTDCDMVLYAATRDADFQSDFGRFPFENGKCFVETEKKQLYRLLVKTGELNPLWTKTAKRGLYEEIMRDYDSNWGVSYGEDLHMSMPLLTKARKIVWLDEKLYFYRVRKGSICNSFIPGIHRDMKRVRMEMEDYMALWGIEEDYPIFYTRVVSNWLVALKSLLKNRKHEKRKEMDALLQELFTDSFFRKAYGNMIPERFSAKDRLLASWLYQGKLRRIRAVGTVFYSAKKTCEFRIQR